MNVSLKIDAKKVTKMLENIATKQLKFAAKNALNNVAFGVMTDEGKALETHLDKPTPYTKRAYEVTKATTTRLTSTVKAKPTQNEYLKYQVFGGTRSPKKTANVLPVAKGLTNQYGNIPKGYVAKMAASPKFFSGAPNGGGPRGIYQRMGSGKTTKNGPNKGRRASWLKLMVAYDGAVSYRGRLPFFETATKTANRMFRYELNKQIRLAIASAK